MKSFTCVILACLSIIEVITAHKCHQGFRGHSRQGHCNSNGCALVRWADSNRDEYMCVSKLEQRTSTQFNCPHTHQRSVCFDKDHRQSYDNEDVDTRRIADVLEEVGIDRVCCCTGHNCNTVNEDISRHFGHIETKTAFQPYVSHSRPVRPRDPDDEFDEGEPQHNEPSATHSVIVKASLILLFSLMFY